MGQPVAWYVTTVASLCRVWRSLTCMTLYNVRGTGLSTRTFGGFEVG